MPKIGPRAQQFYNILTGKQLRREVRDIWQQLRNPQSYQALATINGAPISRIDIKEVPEHVFLSNSEDFSPQEQNFFNTGVYSLGPATPAAPPTSPERNTVKNVLDRLQKIAPSARRAAWKTLKFVGTVGLLASGSALFLAAVPFLPYMAAGWATIGGACLILTIISIVTAARNYGVKHNTLMDFDHIVRNQATRDILADELHSNGDLKNTILNALNALNATGMIRTINQSIANIESVWTLIDNYDRGNRSMTVQEIDNLLRNFIRDNLKNLSFGKRIIEIRTALAQPVVPAQPFPTPPGATPPGAVIPPAASRPVTPPGIPTPSTPPSPTPPGGLSRYEQDAVSICGKTYAPNNPRSLKSAYRDASRLAEILDQHVDELTPQTSTMASDRLSELRDLFIPDMEQSFGLRLTGKDVDPNSNNEIEKTYVIELAERGNFPGAQIPMGKLVAGGDRGAMGEVYLARDAETGEKVAIKIIKPSGADASPIALPELRMRLEFRALRMIRHPNVMEVHAFGTNQKGRPFIVMEYIDGPTLDMVIKKHKDEGTRIAAETAVAWAMQVLRGLKAAHEKETAHRDLKPANVFRKSVKVSPSQRSDVIVLGDFGLAKTMSDDVESSIKDITRAAAVLGTLSYIAPEFPLTTKLIADGVLNRGQTNEWLFRNDIYAVGVILYELLTLEKPFAISGQADFYAYAATSFLTRGTEKIELEETDDLIEQDRIQNAARFTLATRDIPTDLFVVIAKMLAYNPKERYQNCKKAIQALEQGLKAYQDSMADRSHIPTGPSYDKTVPAKGLGVEPASVPPARVVGQPATRTLLTGTKEQIEEDLNEIADGNIDIPKAEIRKIRRRILDIEDEFESLEELCEDVLELLKPR